MSKEKNDWVFNLLKNDPKQFGELLKMFSSSLGQENFVNFLNNEQKQKEEIKKGELIKKPKLENSVKEYKYLISLINEINKCYYFEIYTSLALISRKAIIIISHALIKKNNHEKIDFKDNGAFDKYISWLYENRYSTNQQNKYLIKLKKDSNELHHSYDMETDKKDGEKYFKIIKGLIESNFETEDFNFKSDNKKN